MDLSRLAKLPTEIRLNIYEFVFAEGVSYKTEIRVNIICKGGRVSEMTELEAKFKDSIDDEPLQDFVVTLENGRAAPRFPKNQLAITHTCKEIRRESFATVYDQKRLVVNIAYGCEYDTYCIQPESERRYRAALGLVLKLVKSSSYWQRIHEIVFEVEEFILSEHFWGWLRSIGDYVMQLQEQLPNLEKHVSFSVSLHFNRWAYDAICDTHKPNITDQRKERRKIFYLSAEDEELFDPRCDQIREQARLAWDNMMAQRIGVAASDNTQTACCDHAQYQEQVDQVMDALDREKQNQWWED